MSPREFTFYALMCLVWGGHFVVMKLTVGEVVDPMFYAAVRMTLVAVILSPLLRWKAGQMGKVVAAGACLGGLNYAFMFNGINLANASVAAITMELYAPIAMVLSVIFLRERVGLPRIAGLVLAMVGVLIITLGGNDAALGSNLTLGVMLLIACVVCEASGAVLVKQLHDVRPIELMAWFAVIGACVLWIGTGLIERDQLDVLEDGNWQRFLPALLYSALLASIFGHTTYYWLIHRLPVSVLAPSTLLISVVAIIASVVILREPLPANFILGGLLTMGGVAVILFRNARKTSPPPAAAAIAPLEN